MKEINNSIAICIAAYDRPNSLSRLLKSLSEANYNGENVTLYISIDRSKQGSEKNEMCVKIANEFKWNYGNKVVDHKKENMGLQRHILACGNLTNKYENIIMLEDDILVSPNFYIFAKQMLNFYKDNSKVAGFGIYSFQKCPFNRLPFYPLQTEYDTFFMQYACSWGQMWTKSQWNEFYAWFEENKDKDLHANNFPDYIAEWKNTSWLKYYMKYVVEKDKFFVYPYRPYATNFTDVGTHNKISDIGYQTLISNYKNSNYNFCNFEDTNAVYDIFFENIKLDKILGVNQKVSSNFYKDKNDKCKYLISYERLNYRIVKSYGLVLYPYEQNIINNIEGNDLFLYDIEQQEKNNIKNNFNFYNYIYRIGELTKREYLKIILSLSKKFIKKIIKK